ncbi:hypothetical protein E4T56_gene12833 [Termitomyces sp. T112]|nr:hypothetical protein C0989_003892 [Termitomyces sp. Mn162]KAG5735364.1 hypothetical protein E4T56_gene12833 [Termitomyces sp. T112]
MSTRRRASDRGPRPSIPHSRNCAPASVGGRANSAPTISIPLLREAIDTLDSRMATLMSQRHELETHLERAVRLQSPVLRLPSELLSSIFVMGVFGIGDEDPVMVSTLMLVCRYWSEVALNTPVLWTKISVSPHDTLSKTRRKLERSKSCPLDISITFEPRLEYTTSVTKHVINAMELIRPALWRTKSFRLSVPNRPQAHAALLRCQEDAPLLETLSIHIHHSMQDDAYSSPLLPLFKGHTPRLKSCSLTSFNFGWDRRLISNLRILKLAGYFNAFTPSASTLLSVLRQCPDLEELALRNISGPSVDSDTCRSDDLTPPPSSKSIQLRRLTKISFYYSGIGLTEQIMAHIAYPNLQSLEMCYLENVTPVLQLLYAQASTRLPLLHLRMESCLFNEIKFVNFLRHVPSLISLELVDIDDTSSAFLKDLSSSPPWICPHLEVLNVDGCTAFDWDSLRGLVESRLSVTPTYSLHSLPLPTSRVGPGSQALWTDQLLTSFAPQRLRAIDVTRCSQISKEMVQWLRMYVADVKCEPAKGVWN